MSSICTKVYNDILKRAGRYTAGIISANIIQPPKYSDSGVLKFRFVSAPRV
jgi:hypothetical protein